MTTTFDEQMEEVRQGRALATAAVVALVEAPDLLPLGMLADVARRRVHGTRITYARVARCAVDGSFSDAVPPAAREVRITGTPASLDVALAAVQSARAIAGDRAVSGFTWGDIRSLATASGKSASKVLEELRSKGLERLAEVGIDDPDADMSSVVDTLKRSGYRDLRLNVLNTPLAGRTRLLMQAEELQRTFGCIHAIDPLPTVLNAFRPTTGYEDVKTVAVARLLAPSIPTIQVDWLRYGPKLAQVGLTFGADDLDGVDPSDEAPHGRRRAPLEEVRRNIEAAGFSPVERDGRFSLLS